MTTTIHIEIERLILDGWPLDQRQARLVQAALETELALQLSSPGTGDQFGTSSSLARSTTEPVNWNTAGGAAALGTQLGEAVSRSITQ